ncbi:hypothetical protein Agub_g15369, partial [Astrephomene gubernaculifera]
MQNGFNGSRSPPRHAVTSTLASGAETSDGGGVVAAVAGTFKRARASRPVSLVTGAVGTAAGWVGGALPALVGLVRPGGGGGGRRQQEQQPPSPYGLGGGSRSGFLTPRPGSSGGGGVLGPGGAGSPHSPMGRPRAVPVMVQDGVRWVNLVRWLSLARLFTPCFRPRGGSRRRVRFGGAAGSGRGLLLGPNGEGGGKAAAELAGSTAAPAPTTAAGAAAAAAPGGSTSRPVYIQVRQARQLVWPSLAGVPAEGPSCYCLLLAGDTPVGSTQARQVAGGGGAGGVAGGGGGGSSTVVWNEVFSFPRSLLEAPGGISLPGAPPRLLLQVWVCEGGGVGALGASEEVLVGQAELGGRLGGLLAAERPHPLSAVLELQALDEDTGQVEPGSCGELLVAAWVEPGAGDAAPRTSPCLLPGAPSAAEAGVLYSNLSAPCGSKSMPAVVHSPLGTLYEEPAVAALQVVVSGLAGLRWE